MKKLLILLLIVLYGTAILSAQGELDEQQKVFFRNERSFALLLNTDGFGLSYREAKRIDYLNKKFFEVEAGNLKSPKEYRLSNPYVQSGGTFIFGKTNLVWYLRGSLGRQHELFRKADLGGIAIRYFYSGGPTLAVCKPIYYKVLYPTSQLGVFETKEEKFSSSIAVPIDIYSKASFFRGFGETKVIPGLFVKGGFNFEYSKQDKVIHAVEIGTMIQAFPRQVPIMASTENKAIFLSLFVSYRFGMILDPLNPESNKLSNMFRRKKSE